MLAVARIAAAAALVWAAAVLLFQLRRVWRRGRVDYSAPAGSPARGVLYNFTAAMTPAHKETLRLHPFAFAVGLIMHFGVALAAAAAVIAAARPGAAPLGAAPGAAVLAAAAAAAAFLTARRLASKKLRAISAPDDYVGALATAGFLAAAALRELSLVPAAGFLFVVAAFAFYLPLGKLRHVLFCPLARWEYGWRLGRRGVYPARRRGLRDGRTYR
jgi:hypothetical protein